MYLVKNTDTDKMINNKHDSDPTQVPRVDGAMAPLGPAADFGDLNDAQQDGSGQVIWVISSVYLSVILLCITQLYSTTLLYVTLISFNDNLYFTTCAICNFPPKYS